MFSNNEKISLRQLQMLLIVHLFGTTVVTLPRRAVEIGNQDGWIIIIGIGIMTMLYAYLLSKLAALFPNETIIEYGKRLLPKAVYYIVIAGFFIRIILNLAMEIRIFSEIITELLLYDTPSEVIVITILLLSAYLSRKGIEATARMAEFLFFIIFVPIILITFIVSLQTDYTNILPILKTDKAEIIKGGLSLSFYFSSLELILLVYPFLHHNKNTNKSVLQAILILVVVTSLMCFITIAHFGADDVSKQIWPVMQMMQSVNLIFAERQDAFIITFWILSGFIGISSALFFLSLISSRVVKASTSYQFILPMLPLLYIISLMPRNAVETYKIMEYVKSYLGIVYIIIVPIVLIVIAKLKGVNKKV